MPEAPGDEWTQGLHDICRNGKDVEYKPDLLMAMIYNVLASAPVPPEQQSPAPGLVEAVRAYKRAVDFGGTGHSATIEARDKLTEALAAYDAQPPQSGAEPSHYVNGAALRSYLYGDGVVMTVNTTRTEVHDTAVYTAPPDLSARIAELETERDDLKERLQDKITLSIERSFKISSLTAERDELAKAMRGVLKAHRITVSRHMPETVMQAEEQMQQIRSAAAFADQVLAKHDAAIAAKGE